VPSHPTTSRPSHLTMLSLLFTFLLLPCIVLAQAEVGQANVEGTPIVPDSEQVIVASVTSLIAIDHKYDDGEMIDLSWVPSIDDRLIDGKVIGYKVYRIEDDGEPEMIAELAVGSNFYNDQSVERGKPYSYFVSALSSNAETPSVRTATIEPQREWLNLELINVLIMALVLGGAVILFIETARRGKKLFVRKIAGLEAVDEAIGRATEMGRPILFIPGILDMDDVQTLAALTILGRIARVVADYDTKIFMPVSRSLVMTAGRETIKTSYQAAGRPDAYSDDMVTYITDEQFGYVAAVDGIMVREKPATCFLLGAFFAESLILAETGNSVGAIQIAGTARPAQLPFFIAACDFTLIGEELFAASAYLSGEPKQMGSLKGQDVGKAIAMVAILIGVLTVTIGDAWNVEWIQNITTGLTEIFSTK
jgi:hypothetical protein